MLKPQHARHVTLTCYRYHFTSTCFSPLKVFKNLMGNKDIGSVAVWSLQRLPSVTSYPKQVGTPGASNASPFVGPPLSEIFGILLGNCWEILCVSLVVSKEWPSPAVNEEQASNDGRWLQIIKNHENTIEKTPSNLTGEVLPFLGFLPVPCHHSNVTLTKLFGGKRRFVEESGDVEVCKIDF